MATTTTALEAPPGTAVNAPTSYPTLVNPGRYPAMLAAIAVLAFLVSVWGGLAPFIGPSFGYHPAGGQSFDWTLARGVLAVAPAVAGVIGSLWVLAAGGSYQLGRGRGALAIGGVLSVLAGAWFALGFSAWWTVDGHHYLTVAGSGSAVVDVAGVAVGPGVLLAVLGAVVLGWAASGGRAMTGGTVQVVEVPIDRRPAGSLESHLVSTSGTTTRGAEVAPEPVPLESGASTELS